MLECLECRDLLSLAPASISVTATTLDRPGVPSLGADIRRAVGLRRGDPKPGGNLYAPAAPNGGEFTDALGDRRPIRATEPAHPPLPEARLRLQAKALVGVTIARPATTMALGRASTALDAERAPSGPRRAALVTFRQTPQGRPDNLQRLSLDAAEPGIGHFGHAEDERSRRPKRSPCRYLVGIFSDPPTVSTPPSSGASVDLLSAANAYQTSIVSDDKRGHAIQVVNTMFSARSFTNQKDLYYVRRGVPVQGPRPSHP